MSTKEKIEDERVGWRLPLAIITGVIILWIANLLLLSGNSERGTFGDMFGAINALFSGLAFGGVIYAILLQRRELVLQRSELTLTRNELRGQKEQMAAQNETLKKQNFESTFFQLLRLHNDITNDIDLEGNAGTTKGRDCFRVFYERFQREWNRAKPEHRGVDELDRINKTYLTFYDKYQSEFGHYFRNLFNIFKLIENSEVENKRLYTNLVRAQLSSYELALLFYNALSDMGSVKFKPLIEKYSVLKTLPKNKLLNKEGHESLFKPSSYGKVN